MIALVKSSLHMWPHTALWWFRVTSQSLFPLLSPSPPSPLISLPLSAPSPLFSLPSLFCSPLSLLPSPFLSPLFPSLLPPFLFAPLSSPPFLPPHPLFPFLFFLSSLPSSLFLTSLFSPPPSPSSIFPYMHTTSLPPVFRTPQCYLCHHICHIHC